VRLFAARGEPFAWKLHVHDMPADLPDRLRGAGFEPRKPERPCAPPRRTRSRSSSPRPAASAGWIRFPPRTEFATLWGGASSPRGAVAASTYRRPILERLGFRPVATTTPFIWRAG
jgi:hypothetical protein